MSVHVAAPAGEDHPASQGVHVAAPAASEYVPASQGGHVAEEKRPDSESHSPSCAVGQGSLQFGLSGSKIASAPAGSSSATARGDRPSASRRPPDP